MLYIADIVVGLGALDMIPNFLCVSSVDVSGVLIAVVVVVDDVVVLAIGGSPKLMARSMKLRELFVSLILQARLGSLVQFS